MTYNKDGIFTVHLKLSPKPMAIAGHLGIEELFSRYRLATPPMELGHYQIIWLLATGLTALEVSQVTAYTRIWIYQLLKGYNSERTQRHLASRQRIMVNRRTTGPALWQVLWDKAPDGGLWNGGQVADWLRSRHRTKYRWSARMGIPKTNDFSSTCDST
jgi:hypothetical protein